MKNTIKTIVLIAAIGLISFNTTAQKTNDVPQAVLTAFSTKYPQVQIKSWKDKKDAYIASFIMDNKKYEASYSKDGDWLITERNIRHTTSLPADAQAYLKTGLYASWHIDDMKRVQTPMQNIYQLKVDNHSGSPVDYEDGGSTDNMLLCFDANGKLVKAVHF